VFGLLRKLRHPDQIATAIEAVERGRLKIKLVPEDQDEVADPTQFNAWPEACPSIEAELRGELY